MTANNKDYIYDDSDDDQQLIPIPQPDTPGFHHQQQYQQQQLDLPQLLRVGALSLAAGFLIGYNQETAAKIVKSVYNGVGEIVSGLLFGDDDDAATLAARGPPPCKFMNGVGVIVRRGDSVLLGKRLNSHGSLTYAAPGGRVDPGESSFMCGLRELFEETGITLENIYLYNDAYVEPQTSAANVAQYIERAKALSHQELYAKQQQQLQQQDGINNNNNKPHYSVITNAFECPGATLHVFVPQDNVQLMVRYIVVDMPPDQEPQLKEAEKCDSWHWVKWSDVQKCARYDHAVAQNRLYTQLPDVTKQQVQHHTNEYEKYLTQQHKAEHDPAPCYQCQKIGTDCACTQKSKGLPVMAPKFDENGLIIDPPIPQLSEGCMLKPGLDKLFAPVQALAITDFNPITAKWDDFQHP